MSGLSRIFIQTAAALFLISGLPVSAHADEVWSIVKKDSHFGLGVNTLVLKRTKEIPGDHGTTPAGKESRFLVISHGAIYLAVNDQTVLPAGATIVSDDSRWPSMKLINIGNTIFRDYCFRCRDGISEDPITLKFVATFVDPRAVLTDTLVLQSN